MYVLRAVTNFVCAIATDIVCLRLVRQSFSLTSPPIQIALKWWCFSAILGTYVWRECLKQQIRDLFEFRNTVAPTIETNKPLQNRDGRRLTFNVKEEQHIYFQQLNDAWAWIYREGRWWLEMSLINASFIRKTLEELSLPICDEQLFRQLFPSCPLTHSAGGDTKYVPKYLDLGISTWEQTEEACTERAA